MPSDNDRKKKTLPPARPKPLKKVTKKNGQGKKAALALTTGGPISQTYTINNFAMYYTDTTPPTAITTSTVDSTRPVRITGSVSPAIDPSDIIFAYIADNGTTTFYRFDVTADGTSAWHVDVPVDTGGVLGCLAAGINYTFEIIRQTPIEVTSDFDFATT